MTSGCSSVYLHKKGNKLIFQNVALLLTNSSLFLRLFPVRFLLLFVSRIHSGVLDVFLCFRPYLYIIYILCSAFLTFESFHVICRIRGMKLSHNMHSLDSSKVQGDGTRLDAFLPSECFNSLCHRFEKLLETFLNTPLLQICRLHVEDGGHVSTVN